MAEVVLDFGRITTWKDFHAECKRVMGFPDFYGANMNAWVDCLSYMTNGGDGMSRFILENDEVLTIHLMNTRATQSAMLDTVTTCATEVNERYITTGDIPRIKLVVT